MKLCKKTLEKLRILINGDGTADYRSGPKLVDFFNDLGFNDTYGRGFPSRWVYTDNRLEKINGTPELDTCIKNVFAVVNYVGRIAALDDLISDFNQYLAFDKWSVIRSNDIITFKRLDQVIIDESPKHTEVLREDEFLKLTFDIDIDILKLDANVSKIIRSRLNEVDACIQSNAPLAAIFLIGSMLEGILLGIASSYPKNFNQASAAPKDRDTGKVRMFPDWSLNNFIDVAYEIGILKQDVKKFSHVLRDFRNYIHPYQQMSEQFEPDKQTAMICFQVLKAAIFQLGEYRNTGGTN
mgnify:CR=1 FL=1